LTAFLVSLGWRVSAAIALDAAFSSLRWFADLTLGSMSWLQRVSAAKLLILSVMRMSWIVYRPLLSGSVIWFSDAWRVSRSVSRSQRAFSPSIRCRTGPPGTNIRRWWLGSFGRCERPSRRTPRARSSAPPLADLHAAVSAHGAASDIRRTTPASAISYPTPDHRWASPRGRPVDTTA
jgi:hypothetical protein